MTSTPLSEHLARAGAAHGDERGIALPREFAGAAVEYAALRDGAAVFDLGERVIVRATGADRATFFQGMLTNDVADLRPGQGCPALLLTIQGRVVADVRVAATADALLLDVDRRVLASFLEALDRLIIADDVELAADDATTLVGVGGPATARVVAAAAALAPFAHAEAALGGAPVRVMRAGVIGDGVIVHVGVADAPRVWDAIVAAGATPAGALALEARRVELGLPKIGVDMGEKTLALEVPVDAAISATKGCYLGQEVVARGTARGHVNRRLAGLVFGGPAPAPGTALTHEGHAAGQVTSVAHSYALARDVGLGFVRREYWEPGAELAAAGLHGDVMVRVAAWPLA
jgi:folate-binding protein YgfZ